MSTTITVRAKALKMIAGTMSNPGDVRRCGPDRWGTTATPRQRRLRNDRSEDRDRAGAETPMVNHLRVMPSARRRLLSALIAAIRANSCADQRCRSRMRGQ
jgi:hypothetical protein